MPGAMINTQQFELPLSRTYFHGAQAIQFYYICLEVDATSTQPTVLVQIMKEWLDRFRNMQCYDLFRCISGPSCSKLTTWLVNDMLKFQMLISQMCQYFLLKKCETYLKCSTKASLIFSTTILVY